jgi:hypothetical protein
VTGREFTTLQFAVAARLRPDRARQILHGFEEAGVVERRASRWAATPYGLALSRAFATITPVTSPAARRAA